MRNIKSSSRAILGSAWLPPFALVAVTVAGLLAVAARPWDPPAARFAVLVGAAIVGVAALGLWIGTAGAVGPVAERRREIANAFARTAGALLAVVTQIS